MSFELSDVSLIVVYLLPGFIMTLIINAYNPPKRTDSTERLLSYLGLSVFFSAAASWLYIIINEKDWSDVKKSVLSFLVSFVGSILFGLLFAWVKKTHILRRFFHCFLPDPTAWDYIFAQEKYSYYMIVTLENGDRILGHYSSNSFSSSDYEERDLYLEKTIYLGERNDSAFDSDIDQNTINRLNDSEVGIYIPKDQIKLIQLKKETILSKKTHKCSLHSFISKLVNK